MKPVLILLFSFVLCFGTPSSSPSFEVCFWGVMVLAATGAAAIVHSVVKMVVHKKHPEILVFEVRSRIKDAHDCPWMTEAWSYDFLKILDERDRIAKENPHLETIIIRKDIKETYVR